MTQFEVSIAHGRRSPAEESRRGEDFFFQSRAGERGPVSDRMRAMLQQMVTAALPLARLRRSRRDGSDLSQRAIEFAMTIFAEATTL
jgi:hypothetical protein